MQLRSEGGLYPWVGGGQILIGNGAEYESEQFFEPPAGRRLVIESFTIDASLPVGQTAIQATLLATAAGEGQLFRFPLAPSPSSAAGRVNFAAVGLTKVNVSGGVIVTVTRNATTGFGLANVALSGYLVDLP